MIRVRVHSFIGLQNPGQRFPVPHLIDCHVSQSVRGIWCEQTCAIPWCLFPPNCHPPINHPGGTFYWLIISQLSFHEPPLLPLTANTFKIFIIKSIRLCPNYSVPSPERPITKVLAGCILFEHSSRAAECLSRAATIFLHGSFVSWMSAVITTTDPRPQDGFCVKSRETMRRINLRDTEETEVMYSVPSSSVIEGNLNDLAGVVTWLCTAVMVIILSEHNWTDA